MLITIATFTALLCVLISFHEFGHLIVAKICGMKVDAFSIGFGPKLLKIKLGETEYSFSAIIIGGYVKFAGPNFKEEVNADDPDKIRYFICQPVWKRALTAIAGPLFNFLLAFILLVGMFCYIGIPQDAKIIANRQSRTGNFMSAVTESAKQLKNETVSQTKNVTGMFQGKVSFKEMGGPVAIFRMTSEVVKEGFWMVWVWAIILNIALGVCNLVPIPSLDGGHLFLLAFEATRGRPLPKKFQKWVYIIGATTLILIMVLVTINDVLRLIHQ